MLSTLQETSVTNAKSENYDLIGYSHETPDSHGCWGLGNSITRYPPNLAMKEVATLCSYDYSPTHILFWDRPTPSFGNSISIRYLKDVTYLHLLIHNSILGSSRSDMIQVEPDWLVIAYKAGEELKLSDVEVIVDGLTMFLSSDRFAEVDIALSRADPSRMTADAIVAIAHMTFPAKSKLNAWQSFVERAKIAIIERGDEDDHLEGLV